MHNVRPRPAHSPAYNRPRTALRLSDLVLSRRLARITLGQQTPSAAQYGLAAVSKACLLRVRLARPLWHRRRLFAR
eukprot:6202447-Pleurochrysis_carterae.AAC.11